MTSLARQALERGLSGLRSASLELAVRASNPAGEILRRGVAVSAYNLLEAFIEARLDEIAEHVNRGPLHFADLPDRMQTLATQNLLEVAVSRVRRMPKADVRAFVGAAGTSLAAVSGSINLSPLSWMWSGSNMSPGDYSRLLKAFHVEHPWEAIDSLSTRIGLPAGDPNADLTAFGQERHRAAHDSSHQVSNLWIPVAIDHLVKFAIAFDAFVSIAAEAMRRGDPDYLLQANWTAGKVGIRWVRARSSDWAEFTETGTRAVRVGSDRHTVSMAAAGRCSDKDLLVIVDHGGQVIEWSIPTVG